MQENTFSMLHFPKDLNQQIETNIFLCSVFSLFQRKASQQNIQNDSWNFLNQELTVLQIQMWIGFKHEVAVVFQVLL